jgi:hypothetical protein
MYRGGYNLLDYWQFQLKKYDDDNYEPTPYG